MDVVPAMGRDDVLAVTGQQEKSGHNLLPESFDLRGGLRIHSAKRLKFFHIEVAVVRDYLDRKIPERRGKDSL